MRMMMMTRPLFLYLLSVLVRNNALAWVPRAASSKTTPKTTGPSPGAERSSSATALGMNWLDDIGNMVTGGATLVSQADKPLPYGDPLAVDPLQPNTCRTFCIEERLLSWTGEDFDVTELVPTGDGQYRNTNYLRVQGAMLHLPGKDKMRLIDIATNEVVAVLEHKLLALKPTYEIFRGDNTKLGWIEKEPIALTDTFEVHIQDAPGGFGPLFQPVAYKLSGDFFDRRFEIRNDKGQVVAKVSKDRWIQSFDGAADHYQVQIAAGMDPVLILASVCAMDEEFDQERRKEKQKHGY